MPGLLIGTILWSGIGQANAEQEKTMTNSRYGVQIDRDHVAVKIWVNEVPAYRNEDARSTSSVFFSYNNWLRPGKNHVRYQVRRLKEGPPAKILLAFKEQNMETRAAKDLHTLEREISSPVEGDFSFDIGIFPSLAVWNSTEKVQLDDPTKAAIMQEIRKLTNAVNQKSAAALVHEIAFGVGETMKSMGQPAQEVPPPEVISAFQKTLQNASTLPAIDAAVLSWELGGEGHVVLVERTDGSPIILVRSKDGGAIAIEHLYYGRIGGRWQIVSQ
jgi:hypothetical protein